MCSFFLIYLKPWFDIATREAGTNLRVQRTPALGGRSSPKPCHSLRQSTRGCYCAISDLHRMPNSRGLLVSLFQSVLALECDMIESDVPSSAMIILDPHSESDHLRLIFEVSSLFSWSKALNIYLISCPLTITHESEIWSKYIHEFSKTQSERNPMFSLPFRAKKVASIWAKSRSRQAEMFVSRELEF